MRVLQLIDSLHPGGAERIAVTFANALQGRISGSYLCTTREEGLLKTDLHEKVGYLFLRKKGSLDLGALLRLKRYIKKENIGIVHAHTSSYFIAILLKFSYPKIQIIWHEHQGNRVHLSRLQNLPLYVCSFFFTKIITVNTALEYWCREKLATKEVQYLPNFISVCTNKTMSQQREDTIICVANLKAPKNHLNLLKAFAIVHVEYPEWKLNLVGKDFQDSYANVLHAFVVEEHLQEHVRFSGSTNSVQQMMQVASIGVLSSDDEGLPMVLLEYGTSGLAVVATRVGQCEEVISTFGKTIEPKDENALAKALIHYIENEHERNKDAAAYSLHIVKRYGTEAILPMLLTIYNK